MRITLGQLKRAIEAEAYHVLRESRSPRTVGIKNSMSRKTIHEKSLKGDLWSGPYPTLKQLFLEDASGATKNDSSNKPITLVVMYGPPAAGKGAAKKDIPTFVGKASSKDNYADFLKNTKGTADETEDDAMTSFTTKALGPAVFKSLFDRVSAGEKFESIIGEYFHVNESGRKFELKKILSPSAFKKLFDLGREEGAQEFVNFGNTEGFFVNARGFAALSGGKTLPDLSPEQQKMITHSDGKTPTLGARSHAADSFIDKIKSEISALGGSVEKLPVNDFSTVYLADQAGESTANLGRIAKLGQIKNSAPPGSLSIIGVYIHQPPRRTKMANLHRAAMGGTDGRRVSQKEVDKIYNVGPEMDDKGELAKNGPAIDAMLSANFDQVHVYLPKPDNFDSKVSEEELEGHMSKICEPFGSGKGALDIEGCEVFTPQTSITSLKGLEQALIKKSGITGDTKKRKNKEGEIETVPEKGAGYLPDSSYFNENQDSMKSVMQALSDIGFQNVSDSDFKTYLDTKKLPGTRGDTKGQGVTPWGGDLFGGSNDPTVRKTIKGEARNLKQNILVERWQKLAGII